MRKGMLLSVFAVALMIFLCWDNIVYVSPWVYIDKHLMSDEFDYWDFHCHCCPDPPPPGCSGEGWSCPTAENVTCEETMSSVACTADDHCKVYYKGLNGNSESYNFIDSLFSNDILAIITAGEYAGDTNVGQSSDFLIFPDALTDDACINQHRDYAYIYIPTGQWSFGLKANQSTMSLSGPTLGPCRYCGSETPTKTGDFDSDTSDLYVSPPCCGGQIYSWIGAASGNGSSGSPYTAPTPTKSTLAENFATYSNYWKSLVNFDSSSISLLPEMPKFSDDSGAPIDRTVKIYRVENEGREWSKLHDRLDGPVPGNTITLTPSPSNYHTIHFDFYSTKRIDTFYFAGFTWGDANWEYPKQVDFICNDIVIKSWTNPNYLSIHDGEKHSRHFYITGINANCQKLDVKMWMSPGVYTGISEARFYGETETDKSGGSQVVIRAYGSKADGGDYYDDGYPVMELYVKGSLVKTFYVGKTDEGTWINYTYTHSSTVAPEDVRVAYVNNYQGYPLVDKSIDEDTSKNLWVDYLKIGATIYQTEAATTLALGTAKSTSGQCYDLGWYSTGSQELVCNGYFWFNLYGNRGDTVWSPASYYQAGWYPVELSANWGKKFLYFPQLWWRQGDSGAGGMYSDGVSNGVAVARISSCSPGTIACTLAWGGTGSITLSPGESANITIVTTGTIYNRIINLESPDGSEYLLEFPKTCLIPEGSTSCSFNIRLKNDAPSGTFHINAKASVDGTEDTVCTNAGGGAVPPFTVVIENRDWWGASDADVFTSGKISSYIPENRFLEYKGAGGYPGIPVYADDLSIPDEKRISETGWNVNSDYSAKAKGYNYSFFDRMAADKEFNFVGQSITLPLSGSVSDDGIKWYKTDGSALDYVLTTASGGSFYNLGIGEKMIIFVDGDLTIDKGIRIDEDNRSFLMVIVNGDIKINPEVGSVQGIFFAQDKVLTGTKGVNEDKTLSVKGSVVAMGGVELQRNIPVEDETSVPAESFSFRPDLFLSIPNLFASSRIDWKEVAP